MSKQIEKATIRYFQPCDSTPEPPCCGRTRSFRDEKQLSKIDYKEYPEFMFAMISSFLPTNEGDDLRRVAGKVVFRHTDNYGNTYKNGKIHRDRDKPAIICTEIKDGIIDTYTALYKNGLRHRDCDLPAYIRKNKQQWWKNATQSRRVSKGAQCDIFALIDCE